MAQEPDHPLRRPDIVSQAAGEDTLLYDPVGDAVHVLNAAALFVWEMCDGTHTADDIVTALRTRFSGTEGHDLAGQVRATLARYRANELLAGLPGDSLP